MTNNVDSEGIADGLVAAPVLISDVGSKKRHQVLPELVELGYPSRGALAHAQDTGLGRIGAGGRAFGKLVLDEVGDWGKSAEKIKNGREEVDDTQTTVVP